MNVWQKKDTVVLHSFLFFIYWTNFLSVCTWFVSKHKFWIIIIYSTNKSCLASILNILFFCIVLYQNALHNLSSFCICITKAKTITIIFSLPLPQSEEFNNQWGARTAWFWFGAYSWWYCIRLRAITCFRKKNVWEGKFFWIISTNTTLWKTEM